MGLGQLDAVTWTMMCASNSAPAGALPGQGGRRLSLRVNPRAATGVFIGGSPHTPQLVAIAPNCNGGPALVCCDKMFAGASIRRLKSRLGAGLPGKTADERCEHRPPPGMISA